MTTLSIAHRGGFLPRFGNKANSRFTTAMLALLGVGVLLTIDALLGSSHAQDADQVFTNMQDKSEDLFYNGRTVILILCAVGIVATMATALSGRFPMQKAIVMAFAIIVIAVASDIVTYFASQGTQVTAPAAPLPTLTDTGNTSG
jgi:hypothetical protein